MRILHIIDTLHVGGAERMLIDLACEQIKSGHSVAVVCIFELGELAYELKQQNVQVFCCDKKHGSSLKPLLKLFGFIREYNADVLHSHNCLANYYTALVRCFIFPKQVFINTFHGIGISAIQPRKLQLFGRSLVSNDAIVCVCESATLSFKQKFPRFQHEILTIANGIKIDNFKQKNKKNKIKLLKELSISSYETPLIGIVARLNPVKNHRLLFDAFSIIHKHNQAAQLVVIGDGELRLELEKYTEKKEIDTVTHFLGDRRDVNKLLPGLDVYVLCSTKEGYSISLLEAVAAGLPIVATNVGGNSEIVHHNSNGFLVPSDDEAALAESLSSLLSDQMMADDMGKASRIWAENFGSVGSMAKNYQKVYDFLSPSKNKKGFTKPNSNIKINRKRNN